MSPQPVDGETFVALVTCFNSDDTINYSALRNQVRRQVTFGNNILVCDLLGDFTCLTHAEKVRICAEVVEEADGRVKVLANIGMPSTYQSILLGRDISGLGLNGATVLAPFFADCDDDDLLLHYSRVADGLQIPVYLYNAPAIAPRALAPEMVSQLARHGNIRGLKDNGVDRERMLAYLAIASESDDFAYYAGVDGMICEALAHGAAGCMSDLGNILPRTLNNVCLTFSNGSRGEAQKWQSLLCELHTDLSALGPVAMGVKQLLYLMDNSVGLGRHPYPHLSEEQRAAFYAIVEKYQIV
ncbi:dihydrodipicolinate synthase family protein [uncultured Cohaesibacter sp.]|uniref:dihydrodipicolinate synthase family protein n=1 Tax=uncultured Cohaesibacter sp. TaxID=1002546 RepID=UPI0029C93451|nr:dihydrodipicolinate synthase family protein [uncultured Cohaesibacter sp.]